MELIEKVKKALVDSGFPLEMKIAKVLKNNDWAIGMGSKYVDFETTTLREIDITASKSINEVEVHLFIECKKSENTQLILYAPTHNRSKSRILSPLRFFPKPKSGKEELRFKTIWKDLPLFDEQIPISNNIIFTKGDKVEQNNDRFFNALNGIIKKSILVGSDGYIETDFRMIFLHILIYDGIIYQVQDAVADDFSLCEVPYGQYDFEYRFKFPPGSIETITDIINTARYFNFSNVIEIMNPTHFIKYIETLENAIENIPSTLLDGWGTSIKAFSATYLNSKPSTKSDS